MSRLKVCFISRDYPPEEFSGTATYVYNVAHALCEKGHEVHVISQSTKEKTECPDEDFVHRVGTNPKRYSVRAKINYAYYSWRKLSQLNKEIGFDIVEAPVTGAEGYLFSNTKKNTPLVVRMQTYSDDLIRTHDYSNLKELLSLRILSFFEEQTVRRANRVILNSRALLKVADRLGIPREKVDVVYHGIDTKKHSLRTTNIRKKLQLDDDIMILFVGRLEYRKGLHILYESARSLICRSIPLRVVLVGSDTFTAPGGVSFSSYIQKQAKHDGISDHFVLLGRISDCLLVRLYSACDIFVLPSLHESFGLVLLEAMASSKPVISTNVGGIPEVVEHNKTGILVQPSQIKQLADAIQILATDRNLRIEMGSKARERVEKYFSWSALADSTIRSYQKALEQQE